MTEARGELEYVGFGFGPIQTGLMLLEAIDSGAFRSWTIAEIDAALVEAVRAHGGRVVVNIALADGIRKRTLEGFRILNPREGSDRAELGRAIRRADEMATAIPSVEHYGAGGETSVAALLAANVDAEKPRVLYAAENHHYAAELLREALVARAPTGRLASLDILNTVIGKMSGVVKDQAEMERLGIEPLVPGWSAAVLVEEFSRILVSRPRVPGVRRGIARFQEKDDLLPFEEAKLYGHNAIHSLLGYLAAWRGYTVMSRIRDDQELYRLGERAFLEESGEPLIRRHGGIGDALFTSEGWGGYARDLLSRMTNPWLHDRVDRICRDPARKLAAADRLVGTMCLALEAGVVPVRLALGAAAALRYARASGEGFAQLGVARALERVWGDDRPSGDLAGRVVDLVVRAEDRLAKGVLG